MKRFLILLTAFVLSAVNRFGKKNASESPYDKGHQQQPARCGFVAKIYACTRRSGSDGNLHGVVVNILHRYNGLGDEKRYHQPR